jgi:hypothetical protein
MSFVFSVTWETEAPFACRYTNNTVSVVNRALRFGILG